MREEAWVGVEPYLLWPALIVADEIEGLHLLDLLVLAFAFFRDLDPKHQERVALLLKEDLLVQGGQTLAPLRFYPELGPVLGDVGEFGSAR